ncbi:Uncharacterized protein AC518_4560 [Pseudomonas syringae pv. syringae]|uniref:Uncharacterized protein n=3 Tax=Pseudomonas syringae group TaxID=136849 RepID=A0A3M5WMP1_9PSED|nr:hypothetical protein PSYAR_20345 [Pseudomonas syringae pv. aceris str. M302273]KOG05211.1 Uncharacterized protein ABJ98_5619 [Pseudomonas syringae pv. aceris]KPB18742.1 Uncharacterized protein AC518_4560 [Pseudomonas syringae pv. syringae]KPY57475.1 hypothetical protein ALO46_102055 [Pseudomonas syringae pv. solidagae]RMU70927.1 hypothetical protein ALP23_101764 [Pseudomonas syringae pv. apii]BBN63896.1 hypothetical protein KUIN1_30860 [Pseudomonas sp. KUIN-1]
MTMAGVMVIALCGDWDEWGMKVSLEQGLPDVKACLSDGF